MKTSRLLILLSILSVVGLSSCSKKSDDVTPDQTTTQSQADFQVKIDGKTYAPDFSYALTTSPGNANYYAIYGLDSKTSDVIVIALPQTAAEGTYPLNKTNMGIANVGQENFSTVNGGTGTVTIQKKTATNIIGTFSFTAYDATYTKNLVLTEGKFNVNIKQ